MEKKRYIFDKTLQNNRIYSSTLNFKSVQSIIFNELMALITDASGSIVYINEKYADMLGYFPEELAGKHIEVLNSDFHTHEVFHDILQFLRSGAIWKGGIEVKRKDGTTVSNFVSMIPLLDEHNEPCQLLILCTDLAKQNEKMFQSLLELEHEAVGCFDHEGFIKYVNPAFTQILGAKENINIFDYIDEEEVSIQKMGFEEFKNRTGDSVTRDIRLRRTDHSSITCEVTLKNYLHDPFINGIVFALRDETEQRKFPSDVQNIENIDPLTGLPNQKSCNHRLMVELDHAKENNQTFAVFLLEIDDFKYVNNALGYANGDKLLKELSLRLQQFFPHNELIGRLGGDEFILLRPDIKKMEDVYQTAQKIISFISKEPFTIEGKEFFITISIGISIYPFSGNISGTLLKNAEAAMYIAKKNGKNQYQVFSPAMNFDNYKRFTLKNDAKKALQKNEFCIYYQPRINSKTEEMVSAEALIRWSHSNFGMLPPNEFIPIAEESGLIIPMGEWIIREVCLQIKKWEGERISINKISINLSSRQLLQHNFSKIVAEILEETHVAANKLEFEITETVLIKDIDLVLNTIGQLKRLGITFALDDFGSGYSSLNYLRMFTCETIKIDKCLIDDIYKDPQNLEIVAATIALCKKLKKSVVAEGVETQEQLSLLKELDCDEIQGYYYSKPVNAQGINEFLRGEE